MKDGISSAVLLRTVLAAGLFAGLMLAAFNLSVSDRFIDRAVEWEERHTVDSGAHEDVFTRREQKVGLVVGEVFFGLMATAVFGGVFALTYASLPGARARTKQLALAAIVFVATFAVPFAKYPARPPGVGEPDTVYQRQGLYIAVLALSLLAVIVALRLWRASGGRPWRRAGVVLGYGAAVAALLLFFPGNPDPIVDFPTRLLWEFRVASIAGQVVFWGALAFAFGTFIERFASAERDEALTPAG